MSHDEAGPEPDTNIGIASTNQHPVSVGVVGTKQSIAHGAWKSGRGGAEKRAGFGPK